MIPWATFSAQPIARGLSATNTLERHGKAHGYPTAQHPARRAGVHQHLRLSRLAGEHPESAPTATLYTNDQAGRLFSVTDPILRTMSFGYDVDGRRTYTTNAALEVTRQAWSPRGELTKLTDPATNIASSVYDARAIRLC